MTTIPRCELVPAAGTLQRSEIKPVTDRMTAFLADELLPLLAANWPASSNQLDGNAKGAAMAFGQLLQGFTPGQIRDAVMALAMDADRQFAPRPAELRKACQDLAGPATADKPVSTVSRRQLEMDAVVKMLNGEITETEQSSYVQREAARAVSRGHQVTGMEVWHG